MHKEGYLGYLVSEYPAVSHTFIFREVEGLRALGLQIKTASINPPHALTRQERDEAKSTFIVKQGAKSEVFKWVLKHPFRFLNLLVKTTFELGFSLKNYLYLGEAILLSSWSQSNSIFHLHVHFANPAATVAMIHEWITKIPFSLTVHGPDEFYNIEKNHLKLKFESAAFIIAISDFTKSQIIKIADVKPIVCPLGIYLAKFPFKKHPFKNPVKILSVGRLHSNKGFKILLEAVKGLNIELTIVGEGEERKNLEAMQVQEAHLVGQKSQDEIIRYYEENDLFVLASFAEGLPVVLMEAMSSGLAVIATQINGIPELIENEVTGLLVPPANVELLKLAIIRLMDHPDLAANMAEAARKKVEQRFNLDTNIEKLAKIFRENICSYSS